MAQAGLLMAASACGSVWVWRDYTFRNTQRLATAWPVIASPDSSPAILAPAVTVPCQATKLTP